jgi:hypothetical protein
VRVAAIALTLIVLAGAATAGGSGGPRVAFLRQGRLIVLDLATGAQSTAFVHAPAQAIAWSGDGRLLSDGGRVVGGPVLPTSALAWAPAGETAAFLTTAGAVDLWSPGAGPRAILPQRWGATSLAWGPGGELAVGRSTRAHHDVWLWSPGGLTRVATATGPDPRPLVAGVDGRGRVLWWDDPESSASLVADGLLLYADAIELARTLVFPDYVSVCGAHVALAAGVDRYTTDGKWIGLGGRDVSGDRSLSWVSPSCGPGGLLVAAAGRSWVEPRIGQGEHRAIWELRPRRVQLTHPPAGWTDEDPRVLPDGSILFVRTRETGASAPGRWTTPRGGRAAVYVPGGWRTTDHGRIESIADGHLTWIATTSWTSAGPGASYPDDFGHYGWPWLVAVAP